MKNNIICAAIFAVICVICLGIWQYRDSKMPDKRLARIMKDGEVIREIDLSSITEPYEFDVSDELGKNTIRAEHNSIAVVEADCPDKICVNMGYITNSAAPVVCLPHKLSVEITDGGAEADAVSGR